MAKAELIEAPRKNFPWMATFLGVPLLMFWVGACAAAFAFVLVHFEASEELLKWTTWPLTVIMLGVPLIVGVMFGGVEVLRQLNRMREFLTEIPRFVRDIERVVGAVQAAEKSVQAASRTAQELASAVDTAAVENSNVSADTELVGRFLAHYSRSKEVFEDRLNTLSRWVDFPRYLQRDRDPALEALLEARLISNAEADYVRQTIDMERATRRSGRASLQNSDVERLDELARSARIMVT